MKKLTYLVLTFVLPASAFAQEQTAATAPAGSIGNLHMEIIIGAWIITALIILLASVAILRAFKVVAREMTHPTPYVQPEAILPLEYEDWQKAKKSIPGIWTKMLGLKPLSEEKDIMLEHQFDGISELDNPTPAWFMWLFYSTIAFAFAYMMYFHVLDYGKLQDEEYEIEMAEAKAERAMFLASSVNNIDESSVKENQGADILAAGKAVYSTSCVACHGDKGQGLVGPNLTDPYWIHGEKVGSIFKTIKYGVPEKGMISWEKALTPKQISDVSNYIISLKGSNPANGKAPQGDKEG
ncbi:cbb3-type cytochrome c oxidase N-terminal domain-containing protein [Daejeonella sp.]|uniref:cbb3-type cytochrome c oxidase N-terminal domain-containing protein n=1 Tax=Daejeonella sp. TaxID=2805397 RepID=UPI0030BA36AC